MSSKTFDETALEFMRIYYACHPEKLPADKGEAFGEMVKLDASFKGRLIEQGIKKNKDFFNDQF